MVDVDISSCSCPSNRWKGAVCKHLVAVMQQRGDRLPDFTLSEGQKLKLMELATGTVKFTRRNANFIFTDLALVLN